MLNCVFLLFSGLAELVASLEGVSGIWDEPGGSFVWPPQEHEFEDDLADLRPAPGIGSVSSWGLGELELGTPGSWIGSVGLATSPIDFGDRVGGDGGLLLGGDWDLFPEEIQEEMPNPLAPVPAVVAEPDVPRYSLRPRRARAGDYRKYYGLRSYGRIIG